MDAQETERVESKGRKKMKSIQELRDALIKSASSSSALSVVVGKKEFDALMLKLDKFDHKEQNKDEILAAIDKAKLSILRGMHSGDKVANILVKLVKEIRETCPGVAWVCPNCNFVISVKEWGSSRPICPTCKIDLCFDAAIRQTDVFKEADAYVLRINTIRDSKGKK